MRNLDGAKNIAANILKELDLTITPTAIPSIESGEELLRKWTDDSRFLTHAFSVASACRGYADFMGEDPELYYLTGLLHDFDNQRYPYHGFLSLQEHPLTGIPVLRQAGLPDISLHAILAHASILEIQLSTTLSKVLFAVDELSGFLIALRAVRPGKSLEAIEWKSINKKLKDERFSSGCDRGNIHKGAELLGFYGEESFKVHVLRVASFIESKMTDLESILTV